MTYKKGCSGTSANSAFNGSLAKLDQGTLLSNKGEPQRFKLSTRKECILLRRFISVARGYQPSTNLQDYYVSA